MASSSSSSSSAAPVEHKVWSNSKLALQKLQKSCSLSSYLEQKQSFRRRFLLGLQFYCESPSLILNSDLPADLIEFVTGQGFPVEALGVILELKKASATGSKHLEGLLEGTHNPQRLAEISRRLVEYWMSSDSCAEAFVSLSLGDEIPGLIAETTSFHRILFAIPDCFHLSAANFLKFVLRQCYLIIASISYGIREDANEEKIRSQVISAFLDRICLRFHSDSEHFYDLSDGTPDSNLFIQFVIDLYNLAKNDFVAKRIVSKVFLGFGTHTAGKFGKTILLVGCRDPINCAAFHLLFPAEEFLEKSAVWKHVLNNSIPLKTPTKSKLFWTNWAFFIYSKSINITDVWQTCVKNWESLCLSTAVNNTVLIPATYALIALGREIKLHHAEKSATVMLEAVKVFDSVAKCLDSTSEEKKSCGMALAQVMGDLHTFKKADDVEEKSQKLKFESSNPIFHELIKFYENRFFSKEENTYLVEKSMSNLQIGETKKSKIEILDSDDEIDDDDDDDDESKENVENDEYKYSGNDEAEENSFSTIFENLSDLPIDERLLDIRTRKGKLPSYFSEIVEILLEGPQNKNESEGEALKYLCVMRISFLISVGVRIDSNMAKVLVKCLLGYEGETSLEIPIIFALYEISSLHPFEVMENLAQASFDTDHFTSGFRMMLLRRFSEVIQLLSKTKCFACYSQILKRHRIELISLCPEFFIKYYDTKTNARLCGECLKSRPNDASCSATPFSDETVYENKALTWREIVDQRIKTKTRYFVTPKRKTLVLLPDEYSTKIVPIAWASLANRLCSKVNVFMDAEERKGRGAPYDIILAQTFRVLGRIILGTGGPTCPHLKNIASQVGDLLRGYAVHEDVFVRQAVFALLAIVVSITDGATYILEAVSGGQNIFENLKALRQREDHPENQSLLDNLLKFLTQAAAIGYQLESNMSTSRSSAPTTLRILPDIL